MRSSDLTARIRVRPWLRLASTALMAACAPKIAVFQAEPRLVCAGGETTVRWRVTNSLLSSTTLAISGPDSLPEKVHSSGQLVLRPTDTTHLTIKSVRLGKSAWSSMDLVPYPMTFTDTLQFATDTIERDSLVTRDSIELDPRYRIRTITNASAWPVRVLHGGRTVALSADSVPVAEFEGISAGGTWETHLPRNAAPGAPAHPPEEVDLRAIVQCQEKGDSA